MTSKVTPVLTPDDNFAGRSAVRFGVSELVRLSFTATPPATAQELGGLRWGIASGGGALSGTAGNDGTGLYTAGVTAGPVTLVLKVLSGTQAGATVATVTITVVKPTDAVMVQWPGTHLQHQQWTWSVAFLGKIFLRPTDVSFKNIKFGEGAATAKASGYLKKMDRAPHPVGQMVPVGAGNDANGPEVLATDTVGADRGQELPPPYAVGDFLWPIPWLWKASIPSPGTTPAEFTRAFHHATADATGKATIEKKGAGPFSRVPADLTSGFGVRTT